MEDKIEISKEELSNLEKQTKKKFTKMLINHLKEKLNNPRPKENFYNQLEYKRILTLIEKEKNNNFLKKFSKEANESIITLKVSKDNISKTIKVPGKLGLKDVSIWIISKFDLDACHLYEFDIGNYKFGPRCDEWEEIFDHLDNYALIDAINASNLKENGHFTYLFDFGDNLEFDIEIVDIKKLPFELKNNGKY